MRCERWFILTLIVAAGAASAVCVAAETGTVSLESTASETAPAAAQPSEILARAKAALAAAGTIKAEVKLEVWYPTHYTSDIELFAAPSGDERADMKTTINSDSFRSLEVISGGVLYNEQDTPVGKVVSKIDINEVRKALAGQKNSFAALPALGVNALCDLSGLAELVDFNEVKDSVIGDRQVHVLTGGLSAKFSAGGTSLPPGATRFYKSVAVYVDKEDFVPLRIELGNENGKPILRLDFVKVEKNVTAPEGSFTYGVPPDAQVVDRTQWAISELTGK